MLNPNAPEWRPAGPRKASASIDIPSSSGDLLHELEGDLPADPWALSNTQEVRRGGGVGGSRACWGARGLPRTLAWPRGGLLGPMGRPDAASQAPGREAT